VRVRRQVSRAAYRELAAASPVAIPRPGRWRYMAGGEVTRAGGGARRRAARS